MKKKLRQIQLITLGDTKVGKTSILKRYHEDSFTAHHLSTIGLDFIAPVMQLGGESVTVKIWDTAGQERFRTITQSFYKQAQGVMLVYDVTDENSFNNLHAWMTSINENANTNTIMYLIGNKVDLVDERKTSKESAQKAADKYGMKYFETSAKANINIKEAIETLAAEVYEKLSAKDTQGGKKLTDGPKEEAAKGGCCDIF